MAPATEAPAQAEGLTSHTQNQPGTAEHRADEQLDALARLRVPFTEAEIGVRPAIDCKDCEHAQSGVCPNHHKVHCSACGQIVTSEHTDLSYVGHAEVTARLLNVDPRWDWEPLAVDPRGLPLLDEVGGLWIRLTVAGMTRLGYGDANGKTRSTWSTKEIIGDAIRNAGMRFGMALELWMSSERRERAETVREAVGIPESGGLRLKKLVDWSRTHWGRLDKLIDIQTWATREGFADSLIPAGPDNTVLFGHVLANRIAELQREPAAGTAAPPNTQGAADRQATAGEEPQQDPNAPAPDPDPDPPHQDEPGEEDDLTRMEGRVYSHWEKRFLLEQDRTEVRRLDLQDRNVEGPPQWNGAWMRFEALIDRRLAELAHTDNDADDTERSAA
jgi:ribosomal protein S27E